MAGKDWSYDEILTHILKDPGFRPEVKRLNTRLLKDIRKETYNHDMAYHLWVDIVDRAIDDYADKNKGNIMFEGLGSLNTIFPKQVRKDLALELTEMFEQDNEKEIGMSMDMGMGKGTETTQLAMRVVAGYLKLALDQHAIVELTLFIENTESLYKQFSYMEENLLTKIERGVYDHSKAPKLWQYLVDQGAKDYAKEHGGKVADTFPKKERTELAKHYADLFAFEHDLVYLKLDMDIKEEIPKKMLKKFGDLKKLSEGGKKIVSTEERLVEMQDELSTIEGYKESWLTTEKFPLDGFLDFLKSY